MLFVMGFAAVYLMLFNPRTEANSYVILAPVVALPAAIFAFTIPRPRIATVLYIIAFMLICDAWAYQQTKNWLKPLACVVMFGLMVWEMLDGCAWKKSQLLSRPIRKLFRQSPNNLLGVAEEHQGVIRACKARFRSRRSRGSWNA